MPQAREHDGHNASAELSHAFTHLLDLLPAPPYDPVDLARLAFWMANAHDDPSDGPDPEENLYMPSGYTYFGQFIDHDLTLDVTSTLDRSKPLDGPFTPSNLRTPRLDLDCVYGNGPDDQPYLYAQSKTVFDAVPGSPFGSAVTLYRGASLLPGGAVGNVSAGAADHLDDANVNRPYDLLRSQNGRAMIGDKRNDENSIVNQIQQLFIAFHNRVVEAKVKARPELEADPGTLFAMARDEVRWCYQRIILDDYLPRIIDTVVLDSFEQIFNDNRGNVDEGNPAFRLYTADKRDGLPREFAAAAYRFGHSAVRLAYRLSPTLRLSIFPNVDANGQPQPGKPDGSDSLVGFQPLVKSHVIDDWGRFFPKDAPVAGAKFEANFGHQDGAPAENPAVRLQYAYKLDPSLVEPLIHLPAPIATIDLLNPEVRPVKGGPSLALLNLLRGNRYLIANGQAFVDALQIQDGPLDPDRYMRVRVLAGNAPDGSKRYTFRHLNELTISDQDKTPAGLGKFATDTPLWFYILAEAQKSVVDLWLARVAKAPDGVATLSEDDLKNLTTAADGSQTALSESDATGRPLDASGGRLGWVGGRILAEVFYGLLESDPASVLNAGEQSHFSPIWGPGPASMSRLITFADQRGKQFTQPLVRKSANA